VLRLLLGWSPAFEVPVLSRPAHAAAGHHHAASQASSGGSFAGLGALLLALPGIPLTLIINFVQIRSNPQAGVTAHLGRSLLIALILPALQIGLLIAVSVFRL